MHPVRPILNEWGAKSYSWKLRDIEGFVTFRAQFGPIQNGSSLGQYGAAEAEKHLDPLKVIVLW